MLKEKITQSNTGLIWPYIKQGFLVHQPYMWCGVLLLLGSCTVPWTHRKCILCLMAELKVPSVGIAYMYQIYVIGMRSGWFVNCNKCKLPDFSAFWGFKYRVNWWCSILFLKINSHHLQKERKSISPA